MGDHDQWGRCLETWEEDTTKCIAREWLPVDERALWLAIRQALLMVVDAIERFVGIAPRTSELRHK